MPIVANQPDFCIAIALLQIFHRGSDQIVVAAARKIVTGQAQIRLDLLG